MRAALLVALLPMTVLAGCASGPGGQSASGDGSLAYNGASSGEHASTKGGCPNYATLHWSANLGSGSVTLRVEDAAGATVWSRTVSGPGQAADQAGLNGAAPGTWTLRATRSAGFAGQYAAHLEC